VLTRNDVIRERRNVLLGDFAGNLPAEPWADEVAQMARNILPAFDPGPHLAVTLQHRGLHPFDTLLDNLVNGLAPRGPLRLLLAQALGDVLAVADPGFQGIDLGSGMLDGEGFAMNAEPFGALPARALVGEFEREGRRPGGDDGDVEAARFAVVKLDPLCDLPPAHSIGQDDGAIAHALAGGFDGGNIRHGFSFDGWGLCYGGIRSQRSWPYYRRSAQKQRASG
jgi:hypothetical protein